MVGEVGQGEGLGGQEASGPRATKRGKLHPMRNRSVDSIDLRIPVVFSRCIGAHDAAFLLAEVLRHVIFMRGQIPIPYRQLLETLEAREGSDRVSKELRASRSSDKSRQAKDPSAPGHAEAKIGRKKAKDERSLSKAPAHRRARKVVEALETTTLCIEEAFIDAAEKGRPVQEALILFGASYLSPRTLTKAEGAAVVLLEIRLSLKPHKLYFLQVRCLVGGMSGISLRGLGPSRVHVFLRVADGSAAPEGTPAAAAIADDRVRVAGHPGTLRAGKPPQAPQEALLHLTPRPRFMIRVSKTRPAPRVTVEISKLAAPDAQQNIERSVQGAVFDGDGGGSSYSVGSLGERQALPEGGSIAASDAGGQGIGDERLVRPEGVCLEDEKRPRWTEGVRGEQGGWHQLSCGRLAGMKSGGDSLS